MNLFWPDVQNSLRIWSERMEPQQFEEISNEIQNLHKSMKNVMEVVFATSPLLALSSHGWRQKSYHSTYLVRVGGVSFSFTKFKLTL